MISAIFLAAGCSKRMGNTKLLLPIKQNLTTILELSLNNLIKSKVNEIIIVLGYKYNKISKVVIRSFYQTHKNYKIIYNPDYKKGMSTSIKQGIQNINPESLGIMIVLSDQPFINPDIFDLLIDNFNNKKGIIVPVFNGQRGHPVIFSKSYIPELLLLEGDIGGREILKKYPDDILEVPVNDKNILIDIDDKIDYEKFKNYYSF